MRAIIPLGYMHVISEMHVVLAGFSLPPLCLSVAPYINVGVGRQEVEFKCDGGVKAAGGRPPPSVMGSDGLPNSSQHVVCFKAKALSITPRLIIGTT